MFFLIRQEKSFLVRSVHPLRLLLFVLIVSAAVLSGSHPKSTSTVQADTADYTKKERSASVLSSQIAQESIQAEKALLSPTPTVGEWGVAKQIGEYTYTMHVAPDEKVGTASEIFTALNAYRQRHGRAALAWNNALYGFAQSRADGFATAGTTDAHAGFSDFISNQDGFTKLGFMALGENSSYGYHVEAVHLIEWIYAGDSPHDNNQLSSDWTHVGIGVAGDATDLVFGGRKM